ncbi:aminoglycoside phosphotransferase family protein [Streptomyces durmitorensis]|uniref:Aminoglycoside phosphotransferase family protein n=1 Tax=Streptomyces durmitorensis TaxID=319947 RepID=A0ABY4PW07_9ACTN|nr:aminoglycoside phosphotransferase family protein [Streptomyces durmitorensis]UQT57746.1 aminoglycoside phosphotransferase family protein [Streptomyces durmitorensis]
MYGRFIAHALQHGKLSRGHHNRNYVLPLTEPMAHQIGRTPGQLVSVRLRRKDRLPVVVRTWQDEAGILRAIKGVLPHVPECLAERGDSAVHSYVDGVPFSSICQNGKPVDAMLIHCLATMLAQMTQVRRESLPPLPESWPRTDRGGRSFLRTLARLVEQQIRQPNWTEFGGLFAALGIPEDAMLRYAERVPSMAPRPYSLLHTDLHRDNVIFSYDDGVPPLICVDWEMASYGDPLHDLATHLVRMKYPDEQRVEVIEAWAKAMGHLRPMAVNGLDQDLDHYIAFEHAQSVFPDVIRAAKSLGDAPDQKSLDEATRTVRGALQQAAAPLQLPGVPGDEEVQRVLFRWRAARFGGRSEGGRQMTRISWEPSQRVPEHPAFPRSAVFEALVAEGAAPASRVFKGTAHLNTVVRVPAIDFPVVVRRMLTSDERRERRILSEHAVLRLIEQSREPVRAPRVLALGTSDLKDQFAIHSFEGPGTGDLPPVHPVDGLRPAEADHLVDQLGALARIDGHELDPTACERDFYPWLCSELVQLVEALPKESLKLARELGLPGASRLGELLSRHRLARRRSSLLHGDLNPWNLVRHEDLCGLTVIDWEMAMVGDPLYDLVRHMHLTPVRPEIRQRMFIRWVGSLPLECTTGWAEDWPVYRWVEVIRSAYVDLDRLVTGTGLDAPNVQRAVDSYAMTLDTATASLGLRPGPTANPYLARALSPGQHWAMRATRAMRAMRAMS